jgi:hypothetical protein
VYEALKALEAVWLNELVNAYEAVNEYDADVTVPIILDDVI